MNNNQNMAKFRKQLENCFIELDTVPKKVVSQMADVGIKETKKHTPVSGYETIINSKGESVYRKTKGAVVGGTLRRNWKKTKVHKSGNSWISGYSNNTEYGLYVNNGHRIVGAGGVTKGYVKGKRMLEIGMNAAKRQTETLFQQEVAKIKRKSGF